LAYAQHKLEGSEDEDKSRGKREEEEGWRSKHKFNISVSLERVEAG
jgi:hypothetical protein